MTQIQHETDPNDPADVIRSARAPWTVSHGKSGWSGLSLDPTSTLFVSLFLVLFAFFAVINANAVERPQEATAVMESLHKAFGGVTSDSEIESDLDVTKAGGSQLSRAHESVVEGFPKAKVVVSAGGDEFAVSLPLKGFFIQDTSRLAPSRELFLKSLASIGSQTPADRLRITIEFPDYEADIDGQRKVAALAATLGKYGVLSDHLLAVGSKGEVGQIRLVVGTVTS